MQADYNLQAGERTVPLLFNAFALRDFSRRIGVELEDLYLDLDRGYKRSKGEEVTEKDKAFKREFFPELILSGHLSFCKYSNTAFALTETDALSIVDEMGGFLSDTGTAMLAVCFARMVNADPSAITVEKKSAGVVVSEPD